MYYLQVFNIRWIYTESVILDLFKIKSFSYYMSIELDTSIDYSAVISLHSQYRMAHKSPVTLQNFSLDPNNITTSELRLPNVTLNNSKNSVVFGTKLVGADVAFENSNQLPWDYFAIENESGEAIFQLFGTDRITRALRPYVTKYSDYKSNDVHNGKSGVRYKYRSSNNLSISDELRSLRLGSGGDLNSGSSGIYDPAAAFLLSGSDRNNSNQQNFRYAGGDTTQTRYQIPLNHLCFGLASVDKSLWFNQTLMVKINWVPHSRLGFNVTAAKVATGDFSGSTNVTTAEVLDLHMLIAIEQQASVIQQNMNEVNTAEGKRVLVPQVHQYTRYTAAGSSQNIQVELNKGNGHRVLAMIVATFGDGVTGPGTYDLNNEQVIDGLGPAPYDGTIPVGESKKIRNYQTKLNSKDLRDNRLNCDDNTDYEEMSHLFQGSAVQGSGMYKLAKIHVDTWRSGRMNDWRELDSMQVVDGRSLDQPFSYTFDATTQAVATRTYIWALTQRELHITRNSVRLV